MTWNYRIIRHHHPEGDHLALHEVYYDDAGRPTQYTAAPIDFTGPVEDGPEGIAERLERALADTRRHPVLDATDFPSEDAPRAQIEEFPVNRKGVAARRERRQI